MICGEYLILTPKSTQGLVLSSKRTNIPQSIRAKIPDDVKKRVIFLDQLVIGCSYNN
jgi:hypothetical protein